MKGCVGVEGIFLGFSSNGNVRGQQDKAEGQNQDQVDQKEQTASVLGAQIRKAPDVSHPHSASRCGQDKTDGTTKAFFFFVHDKSILLYDNDMGQMCLCFVDRPTRIFDETCFQANPMSSIVSDIFRDKFFDVSFHETSAIKNFFLYYISDANLV